MEHLTDFDADCRAIWRDTFHARILQNTPAYEITVASAVKDANEAVDAYQKRFGPKE